MKKCYLVFVFLLLFCLMDATMVKAYAKEYPLSTYRNSSIERDGMYVANIEEDMNLYKESKDVVEVFSMAEHKVYLTKEDIDLMSHIVYAESKGEPYEGKVAVASVILNRVVHPSFPKSIKDVINQKNAFSCVRNGKISGGTDDSCYNAVMDAIKGYDPTGNAVYFYNPKIATSSWMKNVNKTNIKEIGNHVFFEVKR